MTVWFTSDSQFDHGVGPKEEGGPTGILRWQANTRPFGTIAEMNDALIDNINSVVAPKDVLYHLGDFCWRNSRYGHFRARIKCRQVFLIRGNHEAKGVSGLEKFFSGVWDLKEIKVGEQPITLCHYSMRTFNKSHHGAWQLFGHSHGSLQDDPRSLSLDVGVDCWDLRPISYEAIAERMKMKEWKPIDHHRPEESEE